jgi:hypothetical protein
LGEESGKTLPVFVARSPRAKSCLTSTTFNIASGSAMVTCVFNQSIYVPGYGVEGWLTIGTSTNLMRALAFMKVATAGGG